MTKRNFLAVCFLSLLLAGCAAGQAPQPRFAEEPASFAAPAEPIVEAEVVVDTAGRSQDFASEIPEADERLVIKNANLSIVVEDPTESLAAIAQMADDLGGFVVSSNLFQTTLESGVEVPRANITIRVPAERLNETLAEIEAGASRVLSKNESGEDVTRDYTNLQSRLRNLEQAEDQLSEIMGSATKTEDVLSVFNQLSQVTEQIEVITGQIQYFEQSAAFSAVTVELIADAAVQPLTIGGWQPVGVAKDALQALINTLKFLAEALIWVVIYVLPVALILLLPLWLVWRAFRSWRTRRAARQAPRPPQAPTGESG